MGLVGKRIEMLSVLIPLVEVMPSKVSLSCQGNERKGKRKVKNTTRGCFLKKKKYRVQRERVKIQSNHT